MTTAGRTGDLRPVYLLYGDEEYLRDAAAREIVSRCLDEDVLDFNYSAFRGGGSEVGAIVAAITSPPVLSERRVVLVRGFDDFPEEAQKALAAAIARMPRTSLVILLAGTIDEKGEPYKLISTAGKAVRYRRMFPSEAVEWLARHARSRGIELDARGREYLVRVVGTSASRLAETLEKASNYAGAAEAGPKRVTLDDLGAVVSGEPEMGIFDLVDAIGERDAHRAIAASRLVASFGEAPVRVLSMISRQVRLLLQTKALQEQGMSAPKMAQAMRTQDYMVRKYVKQARNFTGANLEDAFADMLRTDVELKASGAPGEILLERLILRLCARKADAQHE